MKKQRRGMTTLMVFALSSFALAGPFELLAQKTVARNSAAPLLQSILNAHHAWIVPPGSIRIRGTSIRGNSRQPVTITATEMEETVIEYGSSKRVATSSSQFQDDGEKTTFANAPAAFDQLDITGVFLISQLTRRTIQLGVPENLNSTGGRVTKIHLSGGRTKVHFRQIPVTDELDIVVGPSGLLAEIERTLYPSDSRLRYTQGYRFSDYRETGGVLLPYRIETIFKGNTEETILVNHYEVNDPAAASMFQPRSQSRRAQ